MWGDAFAARRGPAADSQNARRPRPPYLPLIVVAAGVVGSALAVVLPGSGPALAAPPAAGLAGALDPRTEWAGLADVQARAGALGRIASTPLVVAGVPLPDVRVTDIGGATGQFDAREWALELSPGALADVKRRTTAELALVAGVARHEARHAEQWFAMTRLRAAEGLGAQALQAEMGIPARVAETAAQRPLDLGSPQAAQARTWWESVYGAGRVHRDGVLAGLLSAKSNYDGAVRRYQEAPSAATGAVVQAARQALAPAYAAYRALPEEADAFVAQDRYTNSSFSGRSG